jgi:predicted phage-related endonuclease
MSDEDMIVTPLDSLADWVKRFETARDLEKQAKDKKEEARSMIAAYLEEQGAEYGSIKGRIAIRWRTITKRAFDTKKFKAENPQIAEDYIRESSYNQMEVVTDS